MTVMRQEEVKRTERRQDPIAKRLLCVLAGHLYAAFLVSCLLVDLRSNAANVTDPRSGPVYIAVPQSSPVYITGLQSGPDYIAILQSGPDYIAVLQSAILQSGPDYIAVLQSSPVYIAVLQSSPDYIAILQSSPVYIAVLQSGPVYVTGLQSVSGVQYGRLETNVTLVCGTSPLRTPVEWRLNRSLVLPWHRLTSDGALVLLHVDQSAQGNYSCHDNDGVLLHTTRLVLGYPPGLLSVSCRVPSHTLVRCSWVESVKTFLPSQYHAFYRGIHQEWMPCVIGPALRSCDITSPSFWQAYHLLNITAANPLGSTPTVKQIRLHELLKPDPPESVSIEEVEGSPTRLVVNWNNPSSWPIQLAFPLKYEVRYRPLGSGHWSQLETSENSVLIVDALAGYLHQVQVRAQDGVNSDSKWSDWTPLLLAMPWRDKCGGGGGGGGAKRSGSGGLAQISAALVRTGNNGSLCLQPSRHGNHA
ncbi:interleukin-11 receptor subunit alpha-like [Lampris incognitus]|uniref:interleukin-11 receptor subunit alpha-like n=1 Tax=Lampris incognitus TaxID=2546036 RepID=UPI0024B564D1|nr:interleukin-11 receptor subunit alpha-like [Lampris incognitus]